MAKVKHVYPLLVRSTVGSKLGYGKFSVNRDQCGQVLRRPLASYRWLCSSAGPRRAARREEIVMNVFDRRAKQIQKARAELSPPPGDFILKTEVGYRVADRIFDIKRRFPVVAELGCGRGYVSRHMDSEAVGLLYQCDLSPEVLRNCPEPEGVPTFKVVVDEEFLPFKDDSLDMVVSSLSLHWVNDLPGTFRQIHTALRRDGVFLGAMFGGETLFELRCSLQLAQTEREGGFSPSVSPFTDVRDLGNLMNRAGFKMLTIDIDEIKVFYPSIFELMWDLKDMGENNCAWNRRLHLSRDSLLSAAAIYRHLYGTTTFPKPLSSDDAENEPGGASPHPRLAKESAKSNGDEISIPASFQILHMIGWKPDPKQPKPAVRGSGEVSLKDLHRLDELKIKK